jgi:hypothetical protein
LLPLQPEIINNSKNKNDGKDGESGNRRLGLRKKTPHTAGTLCEMGAKIGWKIMLSGFAADCGKIYSNKCLTL